MPDSSRSGQTMAFDRNLTIIICSFPHSPADVIGMWPPSPSPSAEAQSTLQHRHPAPQHQQQPRPSSASWPAALRIATATSWWLLDRAGHRSIGACNQMLSNGVRDGAVCDQMVIIINVIYIVLYMGTHCWRINSLKTNWLGYSPRFRWPWLQLIWGLSWALGRHGDRQNTGSLGIQSGQPPGHGRAVWRVEELETSNMVRAPTDPTAPQKNGASSWNILKLWRTQTSTLLKFSGKAHWLKTGASLVSQPTPFAHSRPFDPGDVCLMDPS